MTPTDEKILEKRRRAQREINAFHRTFETEEGQLVLELLARKFKTEQPAFLPGASGPFDTHAAAIRDGQREVLLYIREVLRRTVTGDANLTETPPPVKSE